MVSNFKQSTGLNTYIKPIRAFNDDVREISLL